MSGKRGNKSQGVKHDSWPGVVRAIGTKALEKGQFVHFGVILVAVILAWKMESADIVKVATLLVSSNVVSWIGWILFIGMSAALTFLLRAQRKMYLTEIERITKERNYWQQSGCKNIQASGYGVSE